MNDFLFNIGMNSTSILQTERDEALRLHKITLAELYTMKSGWSWKLGRLITYIPRWIMKKGVS